MTPQESSIPEHPAFVPLRALALEALMGPRENAETLGLLLETAASPISSASGQRLRVVTEVDDTSAEAYERRVLDRGELFVRPDTWHDRFNVVAWRMFPRTKAALNAGHVAELDRQTTPLRSRRRDALTGFDEDGLVIACADAALERCVREFRWRDLFVSRRRQVIDGFEAVVFGHALLEKLRDPFVGVTGKALFVAVPPDFFDACWPDKLARLDVEAARQVGTLATPSDLAPLPVLGLPGWWAANGDPAFYDDTAHFRPGRRRDSPA